MSNSSERSKPLGFDLRTRIAAAIYKGCDNRVSPGLSRQAADVVIREMGLRQERKRHTHPSQYRYVTEWETDSGSS